MSAARARSILSHWNTVRYELLNTRICDLGLKIERSPIEGLLHQLHRELAAKGIRFRPAYYLTDSWGCPNEVAAVGIPFYHADRRLAQIETEQTGEVEDNQTTMMYLRHEVGHAINYAYRLWEWPGWSDAFGRFSRPYRDVFMPDPSSREFVRHLVYSQHGRSYAQKHPDEDFAETFAVWLTPRAEWRRRYRFWPALKKLLFVASLMRKLKSKPLPPVPAGPFLNPVAEMTDKLAEHYGQRTERYRAMAQGYVDDKLRGVFPSRRGGLPAAQLIREHRDALVPGISQWSGLDPEEVSSILGKLEDRAAALKLVAPLSRNTQSLLELTSLATALAMDFAYTGRFTG